jgi:hypothetical protein
MPLCDELLVALAAHEWSLSSVGPHVCLKVACLRKLFQAFFEGTE